MKKIIIPSLFSAVLFLLAGCSMNNITNKEDNAQAISDSETITIGNQVWMAKNLNVGKMISGDINTDFLRANNSILEKYCYDNSEANCDKYGGLYERNEAMQYSNKEGARGICPKGFHIPTDAEWHILENYLATETCDANRILAWDCSPAGNALKSNGSSGFNSLLSGYSIFDGSKNKGFFYHIGETANFWSSTELYDNYVYRSVSFSKDTIKRHAGGGRFSVRCIKN